jgi:hypothetical protein
MAKPEKFQWKNDDAVDKYFELVKILGKTKNVSLVKGGFAIWDHSMLKGKKMYGGTNCFEEVILRDEKIPHLCPAKHTDFLYAYIKVPVEPKQIKILFSVSGSVSYDPLKNLIYARCASMEANIATLCLCSRLLLNKIGIEEVHKKGLYGDMIRSTINEQVVEDFYKELCKNAKQLNKNANTNDGFWKGAFSVKNDECHTPDKTNRLYGTVDKPTVPKKKKTTKKKKNTKKKSIKRKNTKKRSAQKKY